MSNVYTGTKKTAKDFCRETTGSIEPRLENLGNGDTIKDSVGHKLDMSNFVARGEGRASVGQGIQPTQEQPKKNPTITQEEPDI